jgi:hypothetical protein
VVATTWLAVGFVCMFWVFFFFFFFVFWVFDARGGRNGSQWLRWRRVAVELERRPDMVGGFC